MLNPETEFGLKFSSPARLDNARLRSMASVPSISANILTPYPGTYLFDRLLREGRILHTNWSFYDHTTVCYQPKHMGPEELAERYMDFRRRFFSFSSILKRGLPQLRVAPLIYVGMNLAYRKTTRLLESHYREYFNWLRKNKPAPAPVAIPAPAPS